MSKRILLALSAILLFSQNVYSMESYCDNNTLEADSSHDGNGLQSSLAEPVCFYNYSVDELESCYQRSSVQVKALIRKLHNRAYGKKPQIRSVFFIGKPGADKTTTALMIAYKLQDKFRFDVVDCPDITGENRGATTVTLRQRMSSAIEVNNSINDGKGIIIILDEVQELLDHADDSHYDTASTGRYLTSFLNKNRLNDKIFLIATCNNCGTFPEQIRSRMVGHMIEFEEIQDSVSKLNAFLEQIKVQNIKLDPSCTHEFLLNKVNQLNDWVGRDFEGLVAVLVDQFFEKDETENSTTIEINAENIDRAIQTILHDKQRTQKSRDAETSQEQLERHYKENRIDRETALIHEKVLTRLKRLLPVDEIINTTIEYDDIHCIEDFFKTDHLAGNTKDSIRDALKIMTADQIKYIQSFIQNVRADKSELRKAFLHESNAKGCLIQ